MCPSDLSTVRCPVLLVFESIKFVAPPKLINLTVWSNFPKGIVCTCEFTKSLVTTEVTDTTSLPPSSFVITPLISIRRNFL